MFAVVCAGLLRPDPTWLLAPTYAALFGGLLLTVGLHAVLWRSSISAETSLLSLSKALHTCVDAPHYGNLPETAY